MVEGLLGRIGLRRYWIFFYRMMNARDVRSLASLCVVSWYALNVCVGNFVCSMFKAFLGNALKIGS